MATSTPSEAIVRRKRPWITVLGILGVWLLVMLVAFPAIVFLRPVKRWGGVQLYSVRSLPPAAPVPPPGVSGNNLSPWIHQRLRLGDAVLEWRWSPER